MDKLPIEISSKIMLYNPSPTAEIIRESYLGFVDWWNHEIARCSESDSETYSGSEYWECIEKDLRIRWRQSILRHDYTHLKFQYKIVNGKKVSYLPRYKFVNIYE